MGGRKVAAAYTLLPETLKRLEEIHRRTGMSRGTLIDLAVQMWYQQAFEKKAATESAKRGE